MDESTKNSPCKECDGDAAALQALAEVQHLRQHLADRDAHILALERDFINSTTRATELEEQVRTWREKYERLYDSYKRVQKLNQVLEDKLLQMVDKMKGEKCQLSKDIATLSVRLAETKHNNCMLQKENERYKNDMNLAIQLLQCKPDNFVSQKLDNCIYSDGGASASASEQIQLFILQLQQDISYGPFKSRAVMTEDLNQTASSCASGNQRGCNGGTGEDAGGVCRRKCGCVKTSDKLKHILQTSFPNSTPPEGFNVYQVAGKCDKSSGYGYGQVDKKQPKDGCGAGGATVKQNVESCLHHKHPHETTGEVGGCRPNKHGEGKSKSWHIVSELVTLVQLSVTATALALYYLIYCYMQLVYYTLRSALYFHNADGPMKITIGVVTLTSVIIAFNILMRMEGIIGIVY